MRNTQKKKTTVSLANTPVRRALAKARKSTLLILFILGIAAGFVYKTYFTEKPAALAPPTTVEQNP